MTVKSNQTFAFAFLVAVSIGLLTLVSLVALVATSSEAEAASHEPFWCTSYAGLIDHADDDQERTWIYRSTDGVNYSWIGRSVSPDTSFTDPAPVVGATYQAHYEGLPRVECVIDSEPGGGSPFSCASDAGALSWTNAGANKYWVYRSTDGVNYSWIGRTTGATSFTDPQPQPGATYKVHYQGIPRTECAITAEPVGGAPFECEADDGVITWTDHGPKIYWVYRSTDGVNYSWLGRAIDGATTLIDPNPVGASYQVHYQGLPRVFCSTLSGPVVPDWTLPPANAGFDYQIGSDYALPSGVSVVSRDWFAGEPAPGAYSICYVNAFQTQDDASWVDRPDETSNWPADLILSDEDPNWPGEYLVDVSTPAKRTAALAHLAQMIDTCASKGFDAVEFDNLDSWTRFGNLPFDMNDTIAFATMLTDYTHDAGMASAQKNTTDLIFAGAHTTIGFDFAVVEECGTYQECGDFVTGYGDAIVAIEYTNAGFNWACNNFGSTLSIVRRDVNVTPPGSGSYIFNIC